MPDAPGAYLYLVCLGLSVVCGLYLAWSDFRAMKIPNLCPVLIAAAYFGAFAAVEYAGGPDVFASLKAHVLCAACVFALSVVLYAAGLWGAGDSKLLTACALWTGWQGLPEFLFYATLAGAVLAVLTLAVRRFGPAILARFPAARAVTEPADSWIAQALAGQPVVPYGPAIVLGAAFSFARLGYFTF